MMFGRRKISVLDNIKTLVSSGCYRCGVSLKTTPQYAHQNDMPSLLCETCWESLNNEGRFQWFLIAAAIDMNYARESHRRSYALVVRELEQYRRQLFEEWATNSQGPTPQFGPDHEWYDACYGGEPHKLFPIPDLDLQICTVCKAWFGIDGNPRVPWLQSPERRERLKALAIS
jgi:hypothetical protein